VEKTRRKRIEEKSKLEESDAEKKAFWL